MLEQTGNLWDLAKLPNVLVISTNGFVKNNGEGVLGRGIAKEAKDRFPGIARILGTGILLFNNSVLDLGVWDDYYIFSFPVKYNWWEKADIKLIERSAKQLVNHIDRTCINLISKIYLPQVGAGNGKLNWKDVKKVISPILDDRFVAVTF